MERRYVELEEIGRGGMGRVLRAYDPKLQREVALKEVKSEMLGPAGARRLVAEARAMARLSHPNVVAVYDVEERADDRVVIVMEYVAGQTLTRWLQERRSWQEIVACFRRAGRGLAAAHAAGLLHRDFKPDNVLVGADGRVRVTDFGLAREIVREPTEQLEELVEHEVTTPVATNVTEAGAIVGTLPYLAPERLMGAPADAATDQFAFCVALWEALFGERPFAGHSAIELAFAMAGGRPRPPAGSPRVSAWLVDATARGLAPDARARWPSMHALLTALEHDPAQRRRRWSLAAAGLGVLGLGATALQAWAFARTQRCSEAAASAHLQGAWDDDRRAEIRNAVLGIGSAYAEGVWTRTEDALDDYASAWTRMHVDACAATTVRAEQSATVMDLRMACLHRAEVELEAVTDVLARADAKTVQKAHELVASLRPIARCADVAALQADVEPPLPTESRAVEAVRTQLAVARAALFAGRYDEARRAVDAAREELVLVGYGPVHTEVALARGTVLVRLADHEAAREALHEGLRLASRWRQVDEMQAAAAELTFLVGHDLQRFDEGLRYADLARGLAAGDAEREARVSRSVASVWYAQGEYADAEAENRRALALQEDTIGPDHPDVAQTRHNLALVLHAEGRLDEAEAEHRRALAIAERVLGSDHPDAAAFRRDLAAVLESQGRLDEAEAELRSALVVSERALGHEHPEVGAVHGELAIALAMQGELDEADAELRRALAIDEKVFGSAHPQVAESRHNLANILEERGKLDDAETEHRRALTALEATLGPDHPKLAKSRTTLARLLIERGSFAEARRLAESAWRRRKGADTPPLERAHTSFVLAQAYWADGTTADRVRALELAELALLDFGESDDAAIVRSWIARADVGRRR